MYISKMRFLFLISVVFCVKCAMSQIVVDSIKLDPLVLDVYERQTNTSRMGMTSLNAWAVSNIAVGGIAFNGSTGKERYFHQMNIFWNVVNLSIGIPGLIGTYKNRAKDFESVYKYQKKLENVYVLNMGLDIGYIATGWALDNFGKTKTGVTADRFKGYGNSLVMQGSYLLLHDLVMYFFYKSNNKRLDQVWDKVSIHPDGLGVIIKL